jgi:glycosyl transferase family 9 (putative heptosyltransferase)/CDP-glycerol:poly(glycerophosphate) glycerophosphotransferase
LQITIVNSNPLQLGGFAERTLAWLSKNLTNSGFNVEFVLARDIEGLRKSIAKSALICLGDLRPGPDLGLAGMLAGCKVPLAHIPHEYGFCGPGSVLCQDCGIRAACPESDRLAIYKQLARQASLIVYSSPLQRKISESFVGAYQDKTFVAPPPLLPVVEKPAAVNSPEIKRHVAFLCDNDPGEWSNVKAHALHVLSSTRPLEDEVVAYGGSALKIKAGGPVGLSHEPNAQTCEQRREILKQASALICLPIRPLPFGADALAMLHAGKEAYTNRRVGFRSYPSDLSRPEVYLDQVENSWQSICRKLAELGSLADKNIGPATSPTFSRPLLWCHHMGLGDSINLLPTARALANLADLTWVVPDNHLDILASQVQANVSGADEFDIESQAPEHDLIIEVSVAMKNHYERFYQGDICGQRWVRIDLAKQANAYQSVHENLLSFFSRAELDVAVDRPNLSFDDKLSIDSKERLARAGIDASRDLVITIQPGAGRDFKCWPAERFGKLAGRLRNEFGAKIVLISGLGEDELLESILEQEPDCELALYQRPLLELAGIISVATLHIGNDSGFTHLACACNIPAVGLYGPTAPAQWAPVHPLFELVISKDAKGRRQRNMKFISVEQVTSAVKNCLTRAIGYASSDSSLQYIANPTLQVGTDGWTTSDMHFEATAETRKTFQDLVKKCRTACSLSELESLIDPDTLDFAVSSGFVVPAWSQKLIVNSAARDLELADLPDGRPEYPRCAYVIEAGYQHVFPVLAMLDVLPGPVFTTGNRAANRLAEKAEVIQVDEKQLPMALTEHKIDVVISTSHRISPKKLRSGSRRRVVFIGHGDSDKTYGQDLQPKPSFVHSKINLEFDLLAVASHFHMARYENPNSQMTGYLKHDLFIRQEYAQRPVEPGWVLWAPGWGRHNSVDAWLERVIEATANLDLRCLLHFHPYSYECEARLVQRAQAMVVRHPHFRIAHCLNVLDAMAPCQLMFGDVSTTCYDWLMFDRPIIFLDHERLVVEEEKNLFDVGLQVSPADNLEEKISVALAAPEQLAAARRRALETRFYRLDGQAAKRVRDAIYEKWEDDWRS